MTMTLRQFLAMLEQIAEVMKIENGDTKTETSLGGDAGWALAKRILPRGRRGRR